MNQWMRRTVGSLGIAIPILVAAGCGSTAPVEDAADAPAQAPATTSSSTTAAAPSTSSTSTTTTVTETSAVPDELALSIDESVEPGAPLTATEQLAPVLELLGATDPAGVSQCMVDFAAELGDDVDVNSDAAFVLSLVNCDDGTFRTFTAAAYQSIDTLDRDITSEQLDCAANAAVDFVAANSYDDLQVLFATQETPVEFATAVGEACGLSTEDATFLLDH